LTTQEDQDKFASEMDRLSRKLDSRIRPGAVAAGHYIERRHLFKAWVVTAYTDSSNLPGNDVEFTIVPSRVLDRAAERVDFISWLAAQAAILGARSTYVRREEVPPDTWRGGFSYANAIKLIRLWCDQLNPMGVVRWAVEARPLGSVVPSSMSAPEPLPLAAETPAEHALAAMVRSARSAAAQSGQTRTETAKHKEVRFPSDHEFRAYLGTLLERQNRRCKLSGLPLQLAAAVGEGDTEMQASLDRIDSDRHYEPDNLQIVCWFINRWKSDDSSANFRRLLQAVCGTHGTGSA